MNKFGCCALLTVLSGLLAGCYNTAVCYSDSARMLDSKVIDINGIKGNYKLEEVKVVEHPLTLDFNAIAAMALESVALEQSLKADAPQAFRKEGSSVVPVSVNVLRTKKMNLGVCSAVNDVISLLTLTIWPLYAEYDYTYDISVKFPDRTESYKFDCKEKCLGSIFPLGLIPAPAIADKRAYFHHALKDCDDKLIRKGVEAQFLKSR